MIFILYLWSLAVKSEFDWFSSSLFIGAITAIEIGLSIRRIKRLKKIHYIITSTHIICCDKSFKIKAIPISKVESIELIESYIEKKHDTCSISIFCGEKNYSDDGIENIKYNLTAISKTNSPYDLINSYILGKNTITKSNDVTRVI